MLPLSWRGILGHASFFVRPRVDAIASSLSAGLGVQISGLREEGLGLGIFGCLASGLRRRLAFYGATVQG